MADSTNKKPNDPKVEKKPNPGAAMLFFFIVTSLYCIIGILMGGTDATTKVIMKISYILLVIIGEYFINLNLSNSICGINQWRSTLMITVVPWLLIFGVLHLFLAMFSGWLAPFSNTFGYLVVRLMGLPELMKEILEPVAKGDTERAILSVTTDDSLLVNQFFPENYVDRIDKDNKPTGEKTRKIFDTAWDSLQSAGIIKKFDEKKNVSFRDKLYKFVDMKYTISEYVWNMLTGLLVTSVSYNYILNAGCQKSAINMKADHDAYEAAQRDKKNKKDAEKSKEPEYKQS
jgi:hypothetical protein